MISQVASNDGQACPVASGGCTVHTGRTLHYTGIVIAILSQFLIFMRVDDNFVISHVGTVCEFITTNLAHICIF